MTVHTEKYKGLTIRIEQDEDPSNPRVDFDNMGTMVCFHNRYNLGDKEHGIRQEDFNSWEECQQAIIKEHDVAVILSIFMLDHSGLTINTTGFSCPWDSGQIGFIFVSKETLRNEYSVKRVTKKIKEQALRVLNGEVETYDQYLRGEVYGYVVEDAEGEDLDSCWGFYGDNEGGESHSYCLTEAKSAADYHADKLKVVA